MSNVTQRETLFEEHRPALSRLAYRMLGSLADADDVVQEAYLRWIRHDETNIESPRAYLSAIVTRLCIDHRRQIDARKETYVGPWLPEPIVESPQEVGPANLERSESVSLALLTVLESLSPVERAAYLLRKVFDYSYAEVAAILDKSEAACRQIVSRAEERILERRPRFEAPADESERMTDAFLSACATGDLERLVKMLAADAVAYSDGGGKVTAARVPVIGAEKVARFLIGVLKKAPPDMKLERVLVNGRPGRLVLSNGKLQTVLTLDIVDGRIANLYLIRNPEKLTRVPQP